MAVTTTNDQGSGSKLARYGAGGAIAAGALALIIYARSEQGREKLTSLFGAQFANIDGQLQSAVHENMPLIEEAIDRLLETLHQGVQSLNGEIDRLGDEAKQRLHQYVMVIDERAGPDGSGSDSTSTH
jgi:hypothetical protein